MKKTSIGKYFILSVLFIAMVPQLSNFQSNTLKNSEAQQPLQEPKPTSISGGGYIMNTSATYSWIEISGTGTNVTTDLNNNGQYNISFLWDFPFYETNYSHLLLRPRGVLQFVPSVSTKWPALIPEAEEQNHDSISLLWDDFRLNGSMGPFGEGSGFVFYEFFTSPNRLVIEFLDVNVDYHSMTDPTDYCGTFEVILYQSGDIKFQYKTLNNFSADTAVIGLDHGDNTNYNFFDNFTRDKAPYVDKAIEFTWDKLIPVNYTLDYNENDLEYIIAELDQENMELGFGVNWEDKFGLPSNMKKGFKSKMEVNSIVENSTAYEIYYAMKDWTYRLDSYQTEANYSSSINLIKDPNSIEEPSYLPNFVPLILPNPALIYCRFSNLVGNYTLQFMPPSMGSIIVLTFGTLKSINGHNIAFQGQGVYDENGTLIMLSFGMTNYTGFQTKTLFTLNKLSPDLKQVFSLSVEENDELSWFISKLNDTKMETYFGPDWENLFGYLVDPEKLQKFKINVSSIISNSSHWNITYSIWDYISRSDNFSPTPSANDSIYHRIEPFNYTEDHNMTNIYPLIIPVAPDYYCTHSNLRGDFYVRSFGMMGFGVALPPVFSSQTTRLINGHEMQMTGKATYNSEGILENLYFIMKNMSSLEEERIFEIEVLQGLHEVNGTLNININDEKSWFVRDVNNTVMELCYGSDWETIFGLPSNLTEYNKIKLNITTIMQNSTHFNYTYNIWNSTELHSSYDILPDANYNLTLRNDPFLYSESHNFSIPCPLVLPAPPELYFEYGNLDTSVYTGCSVDEENITHIDFFELRGNYEVRIDIDYSSNGDLLDMNIRVVNLSTMLMDSYTGLNIVNLYEGSKPSYVGINQSDSYEYGSYIYEDNIPSELLYMFATTPNRTKFEIIYIGGEDPINDRVLVLYNRSTMNDTGYWDNSSYVYSDYIYKHIPPMKMMMSNPYFMANDQNWTSAALDFNEYMASRYTPYVYVATAIPNGYRISADYMGSSMAIDFEYTSDGLIDVYKQYYFEYLMAMMRYNDFNYQMHQFTIKSPSQNSLIGEIAPEFEISIIEFDTNTTWYSIFNGTWSENFTFTGSTNQINQTLWNSMSEGNLTIRYYVNDSSGKVIYRDLSLDKDATAPILSIEAPLDGTFYNPSDPIPFFNLTLVEENPDKIWYTLDGGLTNVTIFRLNGTLIEHIWDTVPVGNVTIIFYVRDHSGYQVSANVTIIKRGESGSGLPPPSDENSPTASIPGPDLSIISIMILIGIVGYSWRYKKHRNILS